MSTDTRALAPVEDTSNAIEYVPFGAKDKIKLTVNMVRDLVANPTKSGKTPHDADIVKFMMLCKARELNPWEGDAYLLGYDSQDGPKFSMITAYQAFLKRAEASAEYDGKEQGVVVRIGQDVREIIGEILPPNSVLVGAWCKTFRRDRTRPEYQIINLAAYDKGQSQWNKDKAGMIVKCAVAKSLRHAFPNRLGQMYIAEEIERRASDDTSNGNSHSSQENGNGNHKPPATAKLSDELRQRAAAAKPKTTPTPAPQSPKTEPPKQAAPPPADEPPVDEAERRRREAVATLGLDPDEKIDSPVPGFDHAPRYVLGDEGAVVDQATGEVVQQQPPSAGANETAADESHGPAELFPATWEQDRAKIKAKGNFTFENASEKTLAELLAGNDENLKKQAIAECRFRIKKALKWYKDHNAEKKFSELVTDEIGDIQVDKLVAVITALRNNAPK